MAGRISVFYVDDYKIMRDGMRFIFSDDKEIQHVGEARNANDLYSFLERKQCDVLLLDMYLDAMTDLKTEDGFDICQRIQKIHPEIFVLAHTVYDDGDNIARIMNAGAAGFVSKKSGYEELRRAIKIVYTGKKYVCTEGAKKVKNLNKFLTGRDQVLQSKDDFFSRREREVLALVARGFSSKQIADKLFITEKTVESHRKNMVDKAGVKNTVQLIAYATAIGMIRK